MRLIVLRGPFLLQWLFVLFCFSLHSLEENISDPDSSSPRTGSRAAKTRFSSDPPFRHQRLTSFLHVPLSPSFCRLVHDASGPPTPFLAESGPFEVCSPPDRRGQRRELSPTSASSRGRRLALEGCSHPLNGLWRAELAVCRAAGGAWSASHPGRARLQAANASGSSDGPPARSRRPLVAACEKCSCSLGPTSLLVQALRPELELARRGSQT